MSSINPMTGISSTRLAPLRDLPRTPANIRKHGLLVLDLVNRQNRSRLDRAMADSWKARDDDQVRIAYLAAMAGEDAPLVANIAVGRADRARRNRRY